MSADAANDGPAPAVRRGPFGRERWYVNQSGAIDTIDLQPVYVLNAPIFLVALAIVVLDWRRERLVRV